MKTQCPHCKAGFNITDSSLGKKAKCVKCKQVFVVTEFRYQKNNNSVASKLNTEKETKPEKENIPSPNMKACDNCGRKIGKLETSYTFENHTVCKECYLGLNNTEESSKSYRAPVKQAINTPPHTAKPSPIKHKKNIRTKILWISLVVWTCLMLFLTFCSVSYYESEAQSRPRGITSSYEIQGIDPERTASGCWFCTFSFVWLIVATPLFISAVATMSKKKD